MLLLVWLGLILVLGVLVSVLAVAAQRLSGALALLCREAIASVMICAPLFHIWFLTDVVFQAEFLTMLVGARVVYWGGLALEGLLIGADKKAWAQPISPWSSSWSRWHRSSTLPWR
jgi:hypothetical protein